MSVQDLQLPELLECQPDQGLIRLHDQRVVILSAAAMGRTNHRRSVMTKRKTATSFEESTARQLQEPTDAGIAECAYFRYVERGRLDGSDMDDWLAAEEELHRDIEAVAVSV